MSAAPHSTQDHLPIAGIQDGVVIMSDGSLRVILHVEPINFELKSEEEQNSIIYSYQSFLNSLDTSIQIVVQSKKLDLERYLARMSEMQKHHGSELLRIQTEDYIGFVRRLISVANIMAKRFYVVVSHSVPGSKGGLTQFLSFGAHSPTGPLMDQDQFDRMRGEAYNKANVVAAGLERIGVSPKIVETQELIELFYGIYNPDVATEERLTDLSNLNTGIVTSPEAQAITTGNQPPQPVPEQPAVEPAPLDPANPGQQPPTAPLS